jgi:hypothetical protein
MHLALGKMNVVYNDADKQDKADGRDHPSTEQVRTLASSIELDQRHETKTNSTQGVNSQPNITGHFLLVLW